MEGQRIYRGVCIIPEAMPAWRMVIRATEQIYSALASQGFEPGEVTRLFLQCMRDAELMVNGRLDRRQIVPGSVEKGVLTWIPSSVLERALTTNAPLSSF